MERIVGKTKLYYYTVKVSNIASIYTSTVIDNVVRYIKGFGCRSLQPVSVVRRSLDDLSIILESKKRFLFESLEIENFNSEEEKYYELNGIDIRIMDVINITESYDIVRFKFKTVQKKDWMSNTDWQKYMEYYIHVRNTLKAYEKVNSTFTEWTFFNKKSDFRRNKLIDTFKYMYNCQLNEGDDMIIITKGSE